MGLWWEHVDAQPPEEGCASFKGDFNALSKKWPILWRYHQNWAMLRVKLPPLLHWYHLYFESEGIVMRYRLYLDTDFIFVRIGPDPVRFWVVDDFGSTLTLTFTGRWIRRFFRFDPVPGPPWEKDELELRILDGTFV